jgi:hypothetical protein
MASHNSRRRVSELKHGPNIRSDLGAEAELVRHGQSMKRRQRTPLLILPDGTVVDGNRSLAAALLVGIEELDCTVIDENIDPSSNPAGYRETQWNANEHRQSLTPYEKAVAIRTIKADHPEMSSRQLANEVLHIDPALVTKYLSLWKCPLSIQEKAQAGAIGVNDWHKQSQLTNPESEPAGVVNGSTPTGAEPSNGKHDRPTRIRIPVASATARGAVALDLPQGGDLAAAEALLKEAEKAVRLPRIKLTPAKENADSSVTVTKESSDPHAEALIKEALKLVQEARSHKQPLKAALVEWQVNAKAAQAAQAAPITVPESIPA